MRFSGEKTDMKIIDRRHHAPPPTKAELAAKLMEELTRAAMEDGMFWTTRQAPTVPGEKIAALSSAQRELLQHLDAETMKRVMEPRYVHQIDFTRTFN